MTTTGATLPGAAGAAPIPHRSPGRPRDARCDQAIIQATLDMLAEGGIAGLSMEAVASRAGVGKATIYRRWSSKETLVVDALATLSGSDEVDAPDTGVLRDDLIAWVDSARRKSWNTQWGRILPRMLAEKDTHPEAMSLYWQRVIRPRRERVEEMLRRGMESGELREDLDVDFVADILLGPVTYRQLVRHARAVSPEQVVQVVDLVLEGIRRRP
jgi:AcrR family transcriptional regulator